MGKNINSEIERKKSESRDLLIRGIRRAQYYLRKGKKCDEYKALQQLKKAIARAEKVWPAFVQPEIFKMFSDEK